MTPDLKKKVIALIYFFGDRYHVGRQGFQGLQDQVLASVLCIFFLTHISVSSPVSDLAAIESVLKSRKPRATV